MDTQPMFVTPASSASLARASTIDYGSSLKQDAGQTKAANQGNLLDKGCQGLLPKVEATTTESKVEKEVKPLESKPKDDKKICKRLIVPPHSDIPIKLSHVNIFDPKVCKTIDWKRLPKNAEILSEPALTLPAPPSWTTQGELKRTKSEAKKNSENDAINTSTPGASDPPKPSVLGTTEALHPDVQCPPKKRGRKKKQPEEVAETDDNGAEKTSSKASKPTPPQKRHTSKKPQKENGAEASPKKKAKTDDKKVEAPAKKRAKTSKAGKGQEKVVAEAEKVEKETSQDGASDEPSTASDRTRKYLKCQKEKKRKEEIAMSKKDETKKRQSRKSSAYHAAYKSCTGTEEEKRAAAKKVPCMHIIHEICKHKLCSNQ